VVSGETCLANLCVRNSEWGRRCHRPHPTSSDLAQQGDDWHDVPFIVQLAAMGLLAHWIVPLINRHFMNGHSPASALGAVRVDNADKYGEPASLKGAARTETDTRTATTIERRSM